MRAQSPTHGLSATDAGPQPQRRGPALDFRVFRLSIVVQKAGKSTSMRSFSQKLLSKSFSRIVDSMPAVTDARTMIPNPFFPNRRPRSAACFRK